MDDSERNKLWNSYRENPAREIREKIIVEYAPLVKLVAGKLSIYLGNNVEYDDLVGYGIFGLIDAIDKYDPAKDVKFETYASLRIRGSILDQIRKMDWIPRTIRQKQRKIDEAGKRVEMKTGHAAKDADIAAELGISMDELLQWEADLDITNVASLNDFMEQGMEPRMDTAGNSQFIRPEEKVSQDELKAKLEEALSNLTDKEKKVVLLYYYEDMTLKEISKVLSVSESRISQLHSKALRKMRGSLGEYMGYFTEV